MSTMQSILLHSTRHAVSGLRPARLSPPESIDSPNRDTTAPRYNRGKKAPYIESVQVLKKRRMHTTVPTHSRLPLATCLGLSERHDEGGEPAEQH